MLNVCLLVSCLAFEQLSNIVSILYPMLRAIYIIASVQTNQRKKWLASIQASRIPQQIKPQRSGCIAQRRNLIRYLEFWVSIWRSYDDHHKDVRISIEKNSKLCRNVVRNLRTFRKRSTSRSVLLDGGEHNSDWCGVDVMLSLNVAGVGVSGVIGVISWEKRLIWGIKFYLMQEKQVNWDGLKLFVFLKSLIIFSIIFKANDLDYWELINWFRL